MPRAPHTLPTREEIAKLGERNAIGETPLHGFRLGDLSYEDALRLIVVNLAGALDRAAEDDGCGAEIVYLDQTPPAVAKPARAALDTAVRVAIAAFVIGAAVGVTVARLMIESSTSDGASTAGPSGRVWASYK